MNAVVGIAQTTSLPSDLTNKFISLGLNKKYELAPYLKPSYLKADFNGDEVPDYAVLIINKLTKNKGILIMHGNTKNYYIFGADINFSDDLYNFNWAQQWEMYNKPFALEPQINQSGDITGEKRINLKRPAIDVERLEDGQPWAGGLIYWTGKKYIWIHQGE